MRLGQQASSCSSCCKGCDVRLPLARFTFRSILIRAVLLASAWHVRNIIPFAARSRICNLRVAAVCAWRSLY
jgi:hypothetical protein